MITINCPSGFVFEAREFKTGDIGHISRGTIEQMIIGLLQTCHTQTLDPGANEFIQVGTGKPKWRQVCWADLIFATLEIRRRTFPEPLSTLGLVDTEHPDDDRPVGDMFFFDSNCIHCGKIIQMTVDLVEYLQRCTKRIDEDAANELLRDGYFTDTLVDGQVVRWRPSCPNSDDECRKFMTRKKITGDETEVEVIAKHLFEVEGYVDSQGKPKRDFQALHKWVQELRPINTTYLSSIIQIKQPTFDNELRLVCKECGKEQIKIIPLRHPAFLSPSQSLQAKEAIQRMIKIKAKGRNSEEGNDESDRG